MAALTQKQAYWKAHVEAAQLYDGSVVDYARAHGLEAKKLYVYKTQLGRLEEASANASGFVRVTTPALSAASPVTVTLPNGVRLMLASQDVPGLLTALAQL